MDPKEPTTPQAESGNPSEDNLQNMAALLDAQGVGVEMPKTGEIRTGVIASIQPAQIMVSVGAKSEGMISQAEVELIPAEELAKMEVGQEIPVYVLNAEDHSGTTQLSYVRAREEESWLAAEALHKSKQPFEGHIVGFNKGGLIVGFHELRGFIPSSQLTFARRTEAGGDDSNPRYADMVGQPISVQVLEVDRERRRLILSEKAASSETRDSIREKIMASLKEGDEKKGRVSSIADFGAFINIGGIDGLVHLSEVSWERVRHPGEVLKVGQEVKVKVISVDHESRRIGLSIRRLQEDPWVEQIKGLRVGQLVEAVITRLTKFGAFAKLENDFEGLIHISEISEERIEHPKERLHEGDKVTLRIIKIEPESHRIGLSLRRVDSLAYADMDMKALLKELEADKEAPAEQAAKVPAEAEKSEKKAKKTAEVKAEEAEEKQEAAEEKADEAQEAPAEASAEKTAAQAPAETEQPSEAETPAQDAPDSAAADAV